MSRREAFSEFLNSPAEWHALMHGVWSGCKARIKRPQEPESKQEKHYWRLGYLLGRGLQVVAVVVVGYLARHGLI